MKRITTFTAAALLALATTASAQGITQQQADEILKELRAMRAAIEKLAAPPAAAAPAPAPVSDKVKLADVTGYMLGSPNAPVTVVEFTDLQCPFCSRFSTTTFDEIKRRFIDTGIVRFVSRDFPLSFHPHAMRAAKASRCAGEQGRFWEMRKTLVTNAARLSPEVISNAAKELALDMTAFGACVDSTRFDAQIQKDMKDAEAAGVTGTPSFVIGKTAANGLDGVRVVGAQAFAAFEARITELVPEGRPAAK